MKWTLSRGCLLCLCVLFISCFHFGRTEEKADNIRRKWGAAEVIRDLDHIKDDLKTMIKLQETGEMSQSEMLFYYFRMHDFDDNGLLDGHELMAAMRHTMDHDPTGHSEISVDDLIPMVDSFFSYDDNKDGFIGYGELRKNLIKD